MIDKTINKLHLYEKKLLKQLKEDSNLTPEEIAQKTKMPLKAVTSAAGMLSSKNIISMHKNSTDIINLSKEGEDYAKNGLPEYRILKALQQFKKEGKSEVAIDDIIEKAKVTRQQMNFAIGTLMRNQWARMNQGKLAIQPKAEEVDTDNVEENKFLKFLADHKDIADNEIPEEFKKIQKQFSKRKELFNIKSRQDFDFKLKDLGEQILDHGFEIQDEIGRASCRERV